MFHVVSIRYFKVSLKTKRSIQKKVLENITLLLGRVVSETKIAT